MRFEAPRGTQDLLPGGEPLRERIVNTAKDLAKTYGFGRIITPTFEDTGLFERTSGQGSDVVQKEMYTFDDRSHRSLTLRPEGTAPAARAYLEHGLNKWPQPVKLFYVSPMFRYSRGQRGRYREFWQIGFETLGTGEAIADVELIAAFDRFAAALGTQRLRLELNSIGDRQCRPAYIRDLKDYLQKHERALDDDTREKLLVSPLRVFDTKNPETRNLLQDAPKIAEYLCPDCRAHFTEVRRLLNEVGVHYEVVPTLVRGLDYYSRTVWEFQNDDLGAQSSVCAGGRYDYLVEELGGRPTPAVGWAAGIERLALSVPAVQRRVGVEADIFFVFEDPAIRSTFLQYILDLRTRRKWWCEFDYSLRSPKKQFDHAVRFDSRIIARVDSKGWIRARGDGDARSFRSTRSFERWVARVLGTQS